MCDIVHEVCNTNELLTHTGSVLALLRLKDQITDECVLYDNNL